MKTCSLSASAPRWECMVSGILICWAMGDPSWLIDHWYKRSLLLLCVLCGMLVFL